MGMIKIVSLIWTWATRLPWKFTVPFVASLALSLVGVALDQSTTSG